jgi:hypothetical protein
MEDSRPEASDRQLLRDRGKRRPLRTLMPGDLLP